MSETAGLFTAGCPKPKSETMKKPQHVLLTGATGHIGRYLLRDLLLEGTPVAVLIRPKKDRSAEGRLADLLEQWQRLLGFQLPKPVCLVGDTREEGFGLNRTDRAWVGANCRTLLHNAASVEFGNGTRQTWDNNVSSIQRLLELCESSRLEHLAYVSTAYVCGRRSDIVGEDQLLQTPDFRNEYEHSKHEAERLLRNSSLADRLTVLRPGIVVGDYQSGHTTSYHGFYRAAQFVSLLAQGAQRDQHGRWRANVRLTLSGEERRNFVPVDWVSAAMSRIVLDEQWHHRTYHLTPSQPTTSRQLEDALQEYFHYDAVEFIGRVTLDDRDKTEEEHRFYEYLSGYEEYWQEDPQFDRRNTDQATASLPEPHVDVPCLVRLIDFAVKDRFGRRRARTAAASVTRE